MVEKLDEYNHKRNFDKTAEPKGIIKKPLGNLRFVVQHHLARRDHYDFRLEWDGALLSWAVPKGPSYNTHDKRLAVQVEDHPLEYRNFEGTIPKGEYGGGVVMLWDEGYWEPQVDMDKSLSEGSLKFVLKGTRLKGKWALVRLKAKPGETKDNWLLLKEKDDYAKTSDGISEFITSIRTGRTMSEIEKGESKKNTNNPFNTVNVQLAKLVTSVPEGDEWVYELKYDGYRIVAFIEGNTVRLITRNGKDYTKRFKEIACTLIDWASGRTMVLDGEMVITDEKGKTDFQALQNYMKNPKGQRLTYIIFDLLALDGRDLRKQRLLERKETLETLMKDAPKNLYYSKHIKGSGKESFHAACQANMEGIVGKRADSVYSGGRNGDWIKLKCDNRQEFVIGGYTLSAKKTSGVSSLLLGVYEGKDLVYAGRAGTGLTQRSMRDLETEFEEIKRTETPFKNAPEAKADEKILWLEPVLVAEIKFAEWTKENLLRQASFKGLRTDKDPHEIKREGIDYETDPEEEREEMKTVLKSPETPGKSGSSIIISGIKVSSPDRLVFDEPAITKAEVVRYYASVSERMLPYVGDRILSIVRCPKGVNHSCFFKKHQDTAKNGIVTIPVLNSSGENEAYFYINNTSGIVYEAQMGTLEFHTWGSNINHLENPDIMVFDLDPDEGMDLKTVRQGVKDIKSILEQLSLKSYLKTSGGKGYHVVVPFVPSVEWNTFYAFSRRVAEVMEQKWPDRYTSNVRKDRRKNKIFIDWIRNGRGATSVAPYSLRARKGATVSMPISWEELDKVAPDGIDMAEALIRIEGNDPWKDFFHTNQRLR